MMPSLSITYPVILLAIMPLVLWVYWHYMKQGIGHIAPNKLFSSYLRPSKWYLVSIFLISLIWVSIVLALSRPYLTLRYEVPVKKAKDILIILDISKSMLAEDLSPNRIEKAKEILDTFISGFENDNIWLIVFAGKPFVMSPLTTDYRWLRYILSFISPETIKQNIPWLSWTAIGDAILMANSLFHSPWEKTIILLTDGTSNTGIDASLATEESLSLWVKLYTIGIGTTGETYLYTTSQNGEKNYFLDNEWKKITVSLDEPFLRSLAEKTGWSYYRADTEAIFGKIFDELLSMTKSPTSRETVTHIYDLLPFISVIVLVLAFIEGYVIRYHRAKYNLI